jgi:hypothetical protein
MSRLLFTSICLIVAGVDLRADEPEVLPMPRVAPGVLPPPVPFIEQVPMGPLGPVLPGYFLPDRYAHWKLVAPDQYGFMKPRVILAPQPFYLYNGMPYRFLTVRPRDVGTTPGPRE